ncbi:hypothetical protein [Mycobacterium basiliense]|uniref:hypothetical protein n=1 Tax=Mycobacterium basiliense TaxID=2094119 RepID=UPI001E2A6BB5|nr:hypothetical protein [Mycobacterium basiliense]
MTPTSKRQVPHSGGKIRNEPVTGQPCRPPCARPINTQGGHAVRRFPRRRRRRMVNGPQDRWPAQQLAEDLSGRYGPLALA